jgi:hypothetical protein
LYRIGKLGWQMLSQKYKGYRYEAVNKVDSVGFPFGSEQ